MKTNKGLIVCNVCKGLGKQKDNIEKDCPKCKGMGAIKPTIISRDVTVKAYVKDERKMTGR